MKGFASNNSSIRNRKISEIGSSGLKKYDLETAIDSFTKNHQSKALQDFDDFSRRFLKTLEEDLKEIKNSLNSDLSRVIKKLDKKMKGEYNDSLSDFFTDFHMENEIKNEINEVQKSISKLKAKIYSYINEFCETLLSKNIDKSNSTSLFYFSSEIKSLDKNWNTVSSRSPLSRA